MLNDLPPGPLKQHAHFQLDVMNVLRVLPECDGASELVSNGHIEVLQSFFLEVE